jgi:2-phospho-L-lactate guanylyltransferase
MLRDVIGALRATRDLAGIALLTADAGVAAVAGETGCTMLAEDPSQDMSANIEAAAARLAAAGAHTVVVVPADLPGLTAGDVAALLATHRNGVTVVPATADGGTNALAMTPPGAGQCLFGPDSARRHLAAARLRGLAAALLPLPGFARDIDTVDDVRWLCGQPAGGAAREYLDRSGICARLLRRGEAELS